MKHIQGKEQFLSHYIAHQSFENCKIQDIYLTKKDIDSLNLRFINAGISNLYLHDIETRLYTKDTQIVNLRFQEVDLKLEVEGFLHAVCAQINDRTYNKIWVEV